MTTLARRVGLREWQKTQQRCLTSKVGPPLGDGNALALPFKPDLMTPRAAVAAFNKWKAAQSGPRLWPWRIRLRCTTPVYLPVFAFEGSTAKFSCKLWNDQGDSWHEQSSISSRLVIDFGPETRTGRNLRSCEMMQYAGFQYRHEVVQRALSQHVNRTGNTASVLDTVQPLDAGMMPAGCDVHAFEAKPSFCFKDACNALGHSRSVQQILEWHAMRVKTEDARDAPNDDGATPHQITGVQFEMKSAGLHSKAGAFLAPMWICEYTLGDEHFYAIINGTTGACAGSTHMDYFPTVAVGASLYMSPGLLLAAIVTHGFSPLGTPYMDRFHNIVEVGVYHYALSALGVAVAAWLGYAEAATKAVEASKRWQASDTRAERQASNNYYGTLGHVLGIKGVPLCSTPTGTGVSRQYGSIVNGKFVPAEPPNDGQSVTGWLMGISNDSGWKDEEAQQAKAAWEQHQKQSITDPFFEPFWRKELQKRGHAVTTQGPP